MAGYSNTPLVKKLGLKNGMEACILAAPPHYENILGGLPPGVRIKARGAVDFVHLFTTSAAALNRQFPSLKKRLKPNGLLWVSWPKGTSKIATDLSRDVVREIGLAGGLVDVKVCAVDDDWSGLKFVYRVATVRHDQALEGHR